MWFRVMILVLIVAAFAVLLIPTGCGRELREVVIGEEANGEMITLHVGDTLVLKLDSNPTTGYGWHLIEQPLRLKVLELVDYEFVEREHAAGHMGVGGQEVWYFMAVVGPGETSLDLLYIRDWEEGTEPAAKIFSVGVRVKP